MSNNTCEVKKGESQVEIQCKRLAEIATELHSSLSVLEKRIEPALTPCPPKPEASKDEESLCPVANTLRAIAKELTSHLENIRTLTDRIEI